MRKPFALLPAILGLVAALLLGGCGSGSSADPPAGGLTATARDSSVVLNWTPEAGVEYWLLYSTNSAVSSSFLASTPGSVKVVQAVSPPYTAGSLANGTTYFFTINGRKSGGPAGPDSAVVSATPRIAGATWAVGTPAGTNDLLGVAFGTQYVAVGKTGAMFTSPNATTWTAAPFVVTTDLNAISYSGINPSFVTVGANGTILNSSDGTTWLTRTSGVTVNLRGIANGGSGLWVATGAGGTILTSPDAVTWTTRTSGTTQNLNAVARSTNIFVAVGNAGVIVTSTDGVTWSAQTSGTTVNLNSVAFGNGRFVAVGAAGAVFTSTDAGTWTAVTALGPNALNAVTYGTQFVAVGSAGTIFVSTDGLTWTAATSGTANALSAIVAAQSGYSVVGVTGTNLTSF